MKTLFVNIVIIFFTLPLLAQNPSAVMDVESTDKGLLIPRTDTTTVNSAHGTIATGLMIFQNSDNIFYFYNGAYWQALVGDNLGDHMADQTVALKDYSISNDGDSEGIFINDDGGVSIGSESTTEIFQVRGDSLFNVELISVSSIASGSDLTINASVFGGQSFTVDTTGTMTKLRVNISSVDLNPSGTYASLYQGSDPSTGTLLEDLIQVIGIDGFNILEVDISDISVSSGDEFVLVLEYFAGSNTVWGRSSSDVYSGGHAYINASGWIPLPGQDHWLEALVEVPDTEEVGIITVSDGQNFEINGNLKYNSGNQAENLVLTSDEMGNADWKAFNFSTLVGDEFEPKQCFEVDRFYTTNNDIDDLAARFSDLFSLESDGNVLRSYRIGSLRDELTIGSSNVQIEVEGTYAYIIDSGVDSLIIVDVSSSSDLIYDGNIEVGPNPEHLVVSNNKAYVTDDNGDIFVIDVTDSTNPTLDSQTSTSLNISSIATSGNYLYLIDLTADNLVIYDVSNPMSISFVANHPVDSQVDVVLADGDYVYLLETSFSSGGVTSVDVSTPSTPVNIDTLEVPNIGSYEDSRILSNNLFVLASSDFHTIDISNPANILLVMTDVVSSDFSCFALPSSRFAFGSDLQNGILQYRRSNDCGVGLEIDRFDGELTQGNSPWFFDGQTIYSQQGSSVVVNRNFLRSEFVVNGREGVLLDVSSNVNRVGIGTGSPASKLDVRGGIRINSDNKDENTQFGTLNSDFTLFVDAGTDKVGIGTANTSAKLTVAGDICYTTSIGACSDIRYKKDFEKLNGALVNLLSLEGLKYKWRKDEFPEKGFNDKTHIGVIAQELERYYPELVLTDDEGYKSVNYAGLTPILIEALKEQNGIIEEMRVRQSQFENQLSELTSLITSKNED